jgi:hypothetical protein
VISGNAVATVHSKPSFVAYRLQSGAFPKRSTDKAKKRNTVLFEARLDGVVGIWQTPSFLPPWKSGSFMVKSNGK